MKITIDFNHIEPKHEAIHERLQNWARYVLDRGAHWFIQPMFRHAKMPKTLDTDLYVPIPTDELDGHAIEKAIQGLPEAHRDAIRWFYVRHYKTSILAQCRAQGLTHEKLYKFIRDGRQILLNHEGRNCKFQ